MLIGYKAVSTIRNLRTRTGRKGEQGTSGNARQTIERQGKDSRDVHRQQRHVTEDTDGLQIRRKGQNRKADTRDNYGHSRRRQRDHRSAERLKKR